MEGGGDNMPMQVSSRDLLKRFDMEEATGGEVERVEEEDELSLGLSMNGKFGVDIRRRGGASNLARCSSIPEFINFPVGNQDRTCGGELKEVVTMNMMCSDNVGLMRSCSLPVEREEEWKKRKALQSLRRLEAKRKRSEKQRNMKACRDNNRDRDRNSCLEDSTNAGEKSVVQSKLKSQASNVSCDFKGERKNGCVSGGTDTGRGGGAVGISLPPKQPSLALQGCGGSGSGSGSSGICELESPAIRGVDKFAGARSPINPLVEQNDQRAPADFGSKIIRSSSLDGNGMENPFMKLMVSDNGTKEVARNVMLDMPYVSTKGDGPNRKRIEGFLYRYKKGEEVRIVCVCHGSFLTPAEFVKHGGGEDVAHPLKHIVVSPSSFL